MARQQAPAVRLGHDLLVTWTDDPVALTVETEGQQSREKAIDHDDSNLERVGPFTIRIVPAPNCLSQRPFPRRPGQTPLRDLPSCIDLEGDRVRHGPQWRDRRKRRRLCVAGPGGYRYSPVRSSPSSQYDPPGSMTIAECFRQVSLGSQGGRYTRPCGVSSASWPSSPVTTASPIGPMVTGRSGAVAEHDRQRHRPAQDRVLPELEAAVGRPRSGRPGVAIPAPVSDPRRRARRGTRDGEAQGNCRGRKMDRAGPAATDTPQARRYFSSSPL